MNRKTLVVAMAVLSAIAVTASIDANSWDWQAHLDKYESRLALAENDHVRFHFLDVVALAALELGELEKARACAEENLRLAPSFPECWNYAYAVHHGHLVLGRLALRSGDVLLAEKELQASVAIPGSRQLDTFGPNMSLAKELLERGRRDAVLVYLEKCGQFWDPGPGGPDLNQWKRDVEEGRIPDFGSNLLY